MRASVLLVLGILAATSTATARREENGARVPHRSDGQRYQPTRSDRDWVRIATPTPTKYGTEYLVVSKDAGWFRSLRIEEVSGIVVVRRIQVVTPTTAKTFHVNTTLDRGHPALYIDLGASTQISLVAVTTDRRVAGTYAIYGSSGAAAPVLVAKQ